MRGRLASEFGFCTTGRQAGPTALANGLGVTADFGIDDAPSCDLVIVPGGPGWAAQAEVPATLDYIRRVHASGRIASVCTGGMILAASGVLDDGPATTKREVVAPETPPLEVMRASYPHLDVREPMLLHPAHTLHTAAR